MIRYILSIEPPLRNVFELNSVEELETVFVDCLEGHHHIYTISASLSNDASETNILFTRCGNGVQGVLSDWDIGLEPNGPSGHSPSIQIPRRCGRTVPFMACDLFVNPPPPHLYRHDLESFFYVLVWVAIHYDVKRKHKRTTPGELQRWNNKNLADVFDIKWTFLSNSYKRNQVFRHLRPDFHGLRDRWLIPLWHLFWDTCLEQNLHLPDPNYDAVATHSGHITFDTFMAVIKREHPPLQRASSCTPSDNLNV